MDLGGLTRLAAARQSLDMAIIEACWLRRLLIGMSSTECSTMRRKSSCEMCRKFDREGWWPGVVSTLLLARRGETRDGVGIVVARWDCGVRWPRVESSVVCPDDFSWPCSCVQRKCLVSVAEFSVLGFLIG
jgi:hypothetical protein